MGFWIKHSFGLVVLCLSIYLVFFVDLAGKTLAQHSLDVWDSPTVQEKVSLLEGGVKKNVHDKLDAVRAEDAARAKREMPKQLEISDDDRKALQQLLGKKSP